MCSPASKWRHMSEYRWILESRGVGDSLFNMTWLLLYLLDQVVLSGTLFSMIDWTDCCADLLDQVVLSGTLFSMIDWTDCCAYLLDQVVLPRPGCLNSYSKLGYLSQTMMFYILDKVVLSVSDQDVLHLRQSQTRMFYLIDQLVLSVSDQDVLSDRPSCAISLRPGCSIS